MTFMSQYEEYAPTVTIEVHEDANIEELLESFVTFAVATGYSKDAVDAAIRNKAEGYNYGE
jgi:hypothetical protein